MCFSVNKNQGAAAGVNQQMESIFMFMQWLQLPLIDDYFLNMNSNYLQQCLQ